MGLDQAPFLNTGVILAVSQSLGIFSEERANKTDRIGAISVEQCFSTHVEILSGPMVLLVSILSNKFWMPSGENDVRHFRERVTSTLRKVG